MAEGPVPTALMAATEQLYAGPLISPVTTMKLDGPIPENDPGLQTTT
jgi:hypothetical protein